MDMRLPYRDNFDVLEEVITKGCELPYSNVYDLLFRHNNNVQYKFVDLEHNIESTITTKPEFSKLPDVVKRMVNIGLVNLSGKIEKKLFEAMRPEGFIPTDIINPNLHINTYNDAREIFSETILDLERENEGSEYGLQINEIKFNMSKNVKLTPMVFPEDRIGFKLSMHFELLKFSAQIVKLTSPNNYVI